MIIREFQNSDHDKVQEILKLHWTDPEFIKEVSEELYSYVKNSGKKDIGFSVAEEDGEIVGIAGFREIGRNHYLKPFSVTDSPVEFYLFAVKRKRHGIGEKLKQSQIKEVQKLGYKEILLFSPNSHRESWPFYDKHGFEKVGEVTPPDDNTGQVWRKVL